jgi:hypothetical protein
VPLKAGEQPPTTKIKAACLLSAPALRARDVKATGVSCEDTLCWCRMLMISEPCGGVGARLGKEAGLSGDVGMKSCMRTRARFGTEAGPSNDIGTKPRVKVVCEVLVHLWCGSMRHLWSSSRQGDNLPDNYSSRSTQFSLAEALTSQL